MKNKGNFDRSIDQYQTQVAVAFAATAFAGQLIRNVHGVDGELVFPQFLRHHLTNLADVGAAAPAISYLFNMVRANLDPYKKTLAATVIATSLGFGLEAVDAQKPGRSFDTVDSLCYVVGGAAYYGLMRRRMKQLEELAAKPQAVLEASP